MQPEHEDERRQPHGQSVALRLRPYRAEDGERIYEAAIESRRDLEPWMPWCHSAYSLQEAVDWAIHQAAAFQSKTEYEFLIVDGDGRLLGGCGLNQLDAANRRANLGYWIRSSAAGRGYAVEAVRLLVAWAMENTDLQRLEVVIAVDNVRSLCVAEKAGATREGVLRSRLYLHGRSHDAVMFAFVRGGTMQP